MSGQAKNNWWGALVICRRVVLGTWWLTHAILRNTNVITTGNNLGFRAGASDDCNGDARRERTMNRRKYIL